MSIRNVKTKILATIGPATDSEKQLTKLINAGVSAFRLNFSHGDEKYFDELFDRIHNVCKKLKKPIPILQDLQGPKIRIGKLAEPEFQIKSGNTIEISVKEVLGTEEKVSCSYPKLVEDASIGNTILIDDGLLRLEVIEKKEESLVCKIIEGGTINPKNGMNLPGMKLSTPSLTEKDLKNLKFALKYRVDYVALSFVRYAEDVSDLRNIMKELGHVKPIIAKIEKPEAVEHFEAILKEADGIMVARGDLGVELAPQLVPIIQKNIIRRCNSVGKLVITATQMLESMIVNPIPTRAEASDVANAVLDGTDVVMLSGETAAGKYPIDTIKIMRDILLSTEPQSQFQTKVSYDIPITRDENIFDATGLGFCEISNQINAAAIVVFTHQGRKAKMLAKFKPRAPIFAFSNSFETLNVLNLYKGICPFFLEDIDSEEKSIELAKKILLKNDLCNKGDLLLFTAGAPITDKTRKSWIHFNFA
ncbi:MAG: pyruvate kinase [Melioribacteraceae bacterium]